MLLFLKQTWKWKPYCILKEKPDILLMLQIPSKMDEATRDSLIVLWVQIPIVAAGWNND
jgi:hypothetical protein